MGLPGGGEVCKPLNVTSTVKQALMFVMLRSVPVRCAVPEGSVAQEPGSGQKIKLVEIPGSHAACSEPFGLKNGSLTARMTQRFVMVLQPSTGHVLVLVAEAVVKHRSRPEAKHYIVPKIGFYTCYCAIGAKIKEGR